MHGWYGWVSVAVIALVELAVAIALCRLAAQRWRDYLVIAALAAALVVPFAKHVDITMYLPSWIWSYSDKDQMIDVFIVSTLLLPVITAALIVWVARWFRPATGVPAR